MPEDSVRPETQTLIVLKRRKGYVGCFLHFINNNAAAVFDGASMAASDLNGYDSVGSHLGGLENNALLYFLPSKVVNKLKNFKFILF